MNEASKAPLSGVRILDLTRVIAGPLCTMLLADMGAEVVKIENPERGDDSRHITPPEVAGESHFYLAFNRNKKSVALDIRTPEGTKIINEIAAQSDVFIENFRPGIMKRFGLDYDSMKERYPHLIYVSISAYGQKGSLSYRPGYDPVMQAEFGMMSITGEPDGPPLRHPMSIIDTFTANHAATAICAALYARGDSGKGQRVEISLMNSAVVSLGNVATYYLVSGENPERTGNTHMTSVPSTLFETQNGPIYMSSGSNRMFGRVCNDALNRPDIFENQKFSEPTARSANREELYTLLREKFASDTRENWLEKMRDIPVGAVRKIGEALESKEVTENNLVRTVDHPTAGSIRLLGSPYGFSKTPTVEPKAPPLLGADTEDVLINMIGYDDAKIAELRDNRVIGPFPPADESTITHEET
jgi:crotonobetainyl-CoA:carnitine CoA-transferase CaiB-like acyl-CoA transferase